MASRIMKTQPKAKKPRVSKDFFTWKFLFFDFLAEFLSSSLILGILKICKRMQFKTRQPGHLSLKVLFTSLTRDM